MKAICFSLVVIPLKKIHEMNSYKLSKISENKMNSYKLPIFLFLIPLFLTPALTQATSPCQNIFNTTSTQTISTSSPLSKSQLETLKHIILNDKNYPIHRDKLISNIKKETLNRELKINNLIEQIFPKNSSTLSTKNFKNIENGLKKAIPKIAEINQFIQEPNSISELQAYYNQVVFEAILVTFYKHVPEYLKTDSLDKDWPRINKILYTISQFDSTNGNLSFYNIKKAIEGRYSLNEYILCK